MERFVAILLEHTAGELPIWLTPEQFCIIPVSEKFNDFSNKIFNLLKNYQISGSLDDRNETLGKRIRQAEMNKVPYILVLGEKEMKENKVSVRKRGEGDLGILEIKEFIKFVKTNSI